MSGIDCYIAVETPSTSGAGPGGPLVANAGPESVGGSRSGAGGVTSQPCTCLATGGFPSYTFSWTQTGGDSSIAVSSPSTRTTTFVTTLKLGEAKSASFICTVVDSVTTTVVSQEILVGFSEVS